MPACSENQFPSGPDRCPYQANGIKKAHHVRHQNSFTGCTFGGGCLLLHPPASFAGCSTNHRRVALPYRSSICSAKIGLLAACTGPADGQEGVWHSTKYSLRKRQCISSCEHHAAGSSADPSCIAGVGILTCRLDSVPGCCPLPVHTRP